MRYNSKLKGVFEHFTLLDSNSKSNKKFVGATVLIKQIKSWVVLERCVMKRSGEWRTHKNDAEEFFL